MHTHTHPTTEWDSVTVGRISTWLNLDSANAAVRKACEQVRQYLHTRAVPCVLMNPSGSLQPPPTAHCLHFPVKLRFCAPLASRFVRQIASDPTSCLQGKRKKGKGEKGRCGAENTSWSQKRCLEAILSPFTRTQPSLRTHTNVLYLYARAHTQILHQELDYAEHLSLPAILLPAPRERAVNYARFNAHWHTYTHAYAQRETKRLRYEKDRQEQMKAAAHTHTRAHTPTDPSPGA